MLKLVQFRQQAMASLCIGILFLCGCPFLNNTSFKDPSGEVECKILPTDVVECTYQNITGPIDCYLLKWCDKKLRTHQSLFWPKLSIAIGAFTAILFWFEQGCLLDCLACCCYRYYYGLKPLILIIDAILLLSVAVIASDLDDYDIMNYVLYPLVVFIAVVAYFYSAFYFCCQWSIEEQAINEYHQLK